VLLWLLQDADGVIIKEDFMARGSKASYSSKQKRQAEHIEKGYEKRGVSAKESKAGAWATVNKETGGGKKSGSGRGKKESHASSRKGGHLSHSVSSRSHAHAG
jgi:plasmid stabilization system protein ParE